MASLTASKRGTGRRRWRTVGLVLLLAALLRAWAIAGLPVDFDEPVYLQAGYHYARALQARDLAAIVDYADNREHPALPKLIYGLTIWRAKATSWDAALWAGRTASAVMGTLAALLLALLDPLAAGLLAVHTLSVKYTSQVYLEALPALASLAAVLAFRRSARPRDRWFWLSAAALGATAAGKFTYLVVVVPILVLAWEKRRRWHELLLYAAVAAALAVALDPTLWHQPLRRLGDMLFFHVAYSQGARVEMAGYPWYQPFLWLSSSPAANWHPAVFFYFALDGLIFWLAMAGLRREWRERRWLAAWIGAAVVVLLAWPTKWPQYTLIVTPALCMAASHTLKQIAAWLQDHEESWDWVKPLIPRVSPAFWIAIATALVAFMGWYAVDLTDKAEGKRGWSQLSTRTGDLPSDIVYDIAPLDAGRMLLATEAGIVLWQPAAGTDAPKHRELATGARALSLAVGDSGVVWCGTEAGLLRLSVGQDGELAAGPVQQAADYGLDSNRVPAVTVAGDGKIWIGTDAGAASFDGATWRTFTTANSGLGDDQIRDILVQDEAVWFATLGGLSRLETATGRWQQFTADDGSGLAANAVMNLTADASGTVWAATLGGGLSAWDGAGWRTYLTTNSGLPLNTVQTVQAAGDGALWIGATFGTQPGGLLSRLAGEEWTTFFPGRTGYSGAEPLAIVEDADGRLWIATRTAGVSVYEPQP